MHQRKKATTSGGASTTQALQIFADRGQGADFNTATVGTSPVSSDRSSVSEDGETTVPGEVFGEIAKLKRLVFPAKASAGSPRTPIRHATTPSQLLHQRLSVTISLPEDDSSPVAHLNRSLYT